MREEQWRVLVDTMLARGESTYGNDASKGARRMFGSTSLKTGGKMFALLRKNEQLVVKLPKSRVDELVTAGKRERFDPGDGRLQCEWFQSNSTELDDWLSLATEAEAYVATVKR